MDVSREEALAEAYNRGILPDDMKSAYEEAMSRGLLPNSKENPIETSNSIRVATGNEKLDLDNSSTNYGLGWDTKERTPLENLGRGALVGLERAAQGPAQLIGHGLNNIGLMSDETKNLNDLKMQARMDYYDKGSLGDSTAASVGDFGGQVAPWVAGGWAAKGIPYLGAMLGGSKVGTPILERALTGAAGGALIGGSQFVPEGGSRGENAAWGGLLGGGINSALPPTVEAIGGLLNKGKDLYSKITGYFTGSPKTAADSVLSGINPRTLSALPEEKAQQIIEETKKTYEAGQRLGLQLTPAEASKNPLTGARQGTLGVTDSGAQKMAAFGREQTQAQQKAIDNLFDRISPNSGIVSSEARDAAGNIIKSNEQALAKKAAPYYEEAEKQLVDRKTFNQLKKDSNIAVALNRINNDPIYRSELAGVKPNQFKRLDLVKRSLDDEIEAAMRAGEKNKARILINSKDKLVAELDKVSPAYKEARGIYSTEMPNIKSLVEGDLGRIANLDDSQLQNVAKIIFDPAETDIKVLVKIRDKLSQQNPNLWRQLVRNSMESTLETSRQMTAGKPGSAFYNSILSTDRKFNQYLTALKGVPEAQQTLIDMRSAFQKLLNPEDVRGAAGRAANSMDAPRSSAQFLLQMANKFVGGKYDNAAIDLITSDKWLPYVKEIKKIKDPHLKAYKYSHLLSQIAAVKATSPTNREEEIPQ